MKMKDFVVEEAIIADLKSSDKESAIRELIDALVAAGAAPKSLRDDLLKNVIDRERKGSTGFGKGVAVPHVKHEKIKKMSAAIGVSAGGVEFNALDKAPVYSIILLLSPIDKPTEHLHAMETVFSNLQNDTFRRFLRQANSLDDIKDLLQEADAQQLQG